MGLFTARTRGSERTPERNVGAPRPVVDGRHGRPSTSGAAGLRTALQQLYALKPTREVFAEEAVKILVKSANVKALALLAYESRNERLRVAGTDGLETDAVQALGGDGGHGAWDIPLRALRNRRINVIESAQTNPFVPKSLVAVNPRQLAIATVPFYHSNLPMGVAVLFAPIQRGFPDGLLQTLSQALRVCGMAFAELAPGAAVAGRAPEEQKEQPTLLRSVATLKSELTRLTRALEEAERQRAAEAAERVTAESFLKAQRERVATLEGEVAGLREQLERASTLEGNLHAVQEQLRDAVAAAEAGRSEVDRLKAALTDAQHALKDETGTVEALTAARDELQQQLAEARKLSGERDQVVAQLEARLDEATALAEQLPALRQQYEQSESARKSAEAKIGELRQQVEQSRGGQTQAHTELSKAREALAAGEAKAQQLTEQLAAATDRLRELDEAQKELRGLREQLESVASARAVLQAELEKARESSALEAREIESTLQQWTKRLAAVEAERDRMQAELSRMHARSGETETQLQERLASAERERHRLTERVEALAELQAQRDRLQVQLEEAQEQLTTTREEATALNARVEQLSDVNARFIAERRELHARIESLTKGGQTIEQEKQAAINAAQARVTELESALSRMAKSLDGARTAGADEASRLRAELNQVAEAREALERELAQARHVLDARQREVADTGTARDRLQTSLEKLEREYDELGKQSEAVRVEAAELRRAREENQRRIEALETELRQVTGTRDTLDTELRETRARLTADAETRLADAEKARQVLESTLAAEREERAAQVTALNEQLSGVRAELTGQLEEMSRRHQLAEQDYLAERDRLTQALAEKDAILQTVEEGLTAGELDEVEMDAELDGELVIDRSTGGDMTAELGGEEAPAAAEAAPPEPEEVLILDASGVAESTAERLAELGYLVSALVPNGGDLAADLGSRRFACAAVNLGVPSAWGVVRALRNGAEVFTPPMVAYALAPGSTTGFWFGPTEFTVLPVKESVTELLQRMMPKVRRVIAMSSDLDVMAGLRTELSKARISTAVVLDGRQALDLIPTVRPEAAVLHLSPTCTDVFRAIAGLRSTEVARDIPILFLLDEDAQPREEAFLSAGVRMLSGRGNLKADELIGALADILSPYRPPA